MAKTLIISRAECREILTVERCIPYMKNALIGISEKQAKILQRIMIRHDNGNAQANMPASLMSEGVTGSKVTIFPGPQTAKERTSQGIVPLFSIDTGRLVAIVEAGPITVVRTAATSAAATDALANPDAKTVAILGCGKQGKAHAQAMIAVRQIEKVYMWDLNSEASEKACEMLSSIYSDVEFIPCSDAETAVADADIVCTCTPGKTQTPVLLGKWLKKGAHINAVGTCTGSCRELDGEAVQKSVVFTDWNEAVMRDGGDILLNAELCELDGIPPLYEVGTVLNGTHPGRTSSREITIFESVGISVEDIAAAKMVYDTAVANGTGTWIEL